MLGLVVAFVGMASQWLRMPALDGVAAIAIGIVLALVAALLARESKGLPSEELERTVSEFERRIKHQHPAIRRIFIEAQGWRGHDANLRASPQEGG